jgi:hypothetical protein
MKGLWNTLKPALRKAFLKVGFYQKAVVNLGFVRRSARVRRGQFAEIKAEIEINDWSFWLLRDRSQG